MTYSLYEVRKPRMTMLGQGVGVRAHYPIPYIGFGNDCGAKGDSYEGRGLILYATGNYISNS